MKPQQKESKCEWISMITMDKKETTEKKKEYVKKNKSQHRRTPNGLIIIPSVSHL